MRHFIFTKFAWMGIQKNKQLYYPYLMAGVIMVMVYYIFAFLAASGVVHGLPGGEAVVELFGIGSWLVGIFSVPFLFYTNSTLIKKRKKELGLYNILGMDKKNLFFIMFQEALITYVITVCGGIFMGIVLSKTAELGIVNIMGREVNYRIYVEGKGVLGAILIFAIIFLLIFLNMLRQIYHNNPIDLLHSEASGERPPRNHWFIAVIGLGCIVAAYTLSAGMDTANQAIQSSFGIALLIIVGTFLLFICASVVLCKIMKSSKKYYYKTAHFVTVSSMEYRMKRNGASLASICSLITLILVTLVAAVGFYKGWEKNMEDYYPYDIGITADIPEKEVADELSAGSYTKEIRQQIDRVMKGKQSGGAEGFEIYTANMLGRMSGNKLDLRADKNNKKSDRTVLVRVLTREAYGRICDDPEELSDGTVLAASTDVEGMIDGINLCDGSVIKVDQTTRKIPKMAKIKAYDNKVDTGKIRQIFLVVPDLYSFLGKGPDLSAYVKNNSLTFRFEYNIHLAEEESAQSGVYQEIKTKVKGVSSYLRAEREERMHGLSGGILFLMLVLIIIFVFVTTLIMYYKQISEGYEDQKRFLIMRKLGMTKKEIRKSINSQMLTVFGLPLAVAGFHLVFTSQILYLIMQRAMIDDRPLIMQVMIISYAAFAVVYSFVYFLTSRTYFRIVNR